MKKTDVDKYIDNDTRNIYNDAANNTTLKKEFGLTKEIIENISKEKDEPDWVLDIRLKALEQFFKISKLRTFHYRLLFWPTIFVLCMRFSSFKIIWINIDLSHHIIVF